MLGGMDAHGFPIRSTGQKKPSNNGDHTYRAARETKTNLGHANLRKEQK